MGKVTVGLKADRHKRRLYLPRLTHEALGRPSLAQVEYDGEALALRIVPPTKPHYTYRIAVRNERASMHIGIHRRGTSTYAEAVEMPEGRYEPIATNVFMHESRVDMRPEAQLARLMIPIKDFHKFFQVGRQWRCLNYLRNVTMPGTLVCPNDGPLDWHREVRERRLLVKFQCVYCGHNFFPGEGTLFPRTKAGVITWMYGLWYLVHHPEATYHDLEGYKIARTIPPISHSVAVRMVQQLQKFLPPRNLVFNWRPYHNYVRSQDLVYLRVNPKQFSLTAKAWSIMGEPKRVSLSADPVEGVITVTPDPDGAHALNPKHRLGYARTSMMATVAAIEDSTPLGIYEPISIGRFEGVFKLTRQHKRIEDQRPNPATYKFRDRWLGMKPSKGALAQRARRLRELSERLEEERAR